MLKTNRGRPVRGKAKRIRTSFTLQPRHVEYLESCALERGISKSEVLDIVIEESEGFRKNANHLKRPQIPIPKVKIADFCKKKGISRMSIFGSALSDDFTRDSDVDLLLEFEKGRVPTLFEIADFEFELSEIFDGRKIDLRTEGDLGDHIRKKVIKSALVIYKTDL